MPRGPQSHKRPADVIGNAVRVMRIATGKETEEAELATRSATEELGAGGEAVPSDHSITLLAGAASVVALEQGLYAIGVEPSAGQKADDPTTPSLLVTKYPASGGEPVSLMAASGEQDIWFDKRGGIVVVRSPRGGGSILVTVLGRAVSPPSHPKLTVHRLDGEPAAGNVPFANLAVAAPRRATEPNLEQGREIPIEIVLHIERLGDRLLRADGWVGNRGSKMRIEGFGIRPLEGLSPRDIHYKVFHLGGIETPWIGGPQLCGSRGQQMPIIGFAIRVAPHLRDRFDVEYQGAFFHSGLANQNRNSEPCRPRLAGDPLEAMFIKIIERPRT
jgi:hypothetical protein